MPPRPRSITGVEVMPISGVTSGQPRSLRGNHPERSRRVATYAIRVGSEDTAVLGGDVQNISGSMTGNGHIREVKRLRIDFAVHDECAELPEFCWIHIRSRQDCFMGVLTGAHIVVMVGSRIDCGWCRGGVRSSTGTAGHRTSASFKQP